MTMKQFLSTLSILAVLLFAGCDNNTITDPHPEPEPDPHPEPEAFTIDLKVEDVTPYEAMLTITPSDNEVEYTCVFLAYDQVPVFDEDEEDILAAVILERFDPVILMGEWSEKLGPLTPNTKYSVLAFGVKDNMPQSQLFRYDFTSETAGECEITIESINLLKLFDSREIVALDPSFEGQLAECECIAIVEMKTSVPTHKLYFWWYEGYTKDEYRDEAFLEDLLLYDYAHNPEVMDMYYSLDEEDKFFFAGIVEDDNGNLSPVYYSESFTLSKAQCDPVEEFFEYVITPSANTFMLAR